MKQERLFTVYYPHRSVFQKVSKTFKLQKLIIVSCGVF